MEENLIALHLAKFSIKGYKMHTSELNRALKKHWQKNLESIHFIFSSLAHARFRKVDYVNLSSQLKWQADMTQTTFLLPAYTYSARRGIHFTDQIKPDPQVGSLSRIAFEEGLFTSRTTDPDFSYLILGAKHGLDKSHFTRSFGDNSFHEAIFKKKNTKITLLGPVLDVGLTTIMHLEAKVGVPWRQFIKLDYKCNHFNCNSQHEYFARTNESQQHYSPSRKNLYAYIESLQNTTSSVIGNIQILTFDWLDFSEWFKFKLSQDPYFQESKF